MSQIFVTLEMWDKNHCATVADDAFKGSLKFWETLPRFFAPVAWQDDHHVYLSYIQHRDCHAMMGLTELSTEIGMR